MINAAPLQPRLLRQLQTRIKPHVAVLVHAMTLPFEEVFTLAIVRLLQELLSSFEEADPCGAKFAVRIRASLSAIPVLLFGFEAAEQFVFQR